MTETIAPPTILEAHDLTKVYRIGKVDVPALRRCFARHQKRRIRCDYGTVGLRQINDVASFGRFAVTHQRKNHY